MTRTGKFLLLLATTALSGAAATALGGSALAQSIGTLATGSSASGDKNAPVSFTADSLSYDKTGKIITATGHVVAIQNGQTLHADKVTINRATNVVTADGHVVLTQPDGSNTVYAEHVVLSHNMKDGVMEAVAARLAQNARIIANGGRRYDAKLDELSKPVYSACDLCKSDPRSPPTWAIRAASATRDLEHKMIEFRDATLLMKGIPVFWLPYLSEPDPSVKRQSGFLIPSGGATSQLGAFAVIPYYLTLGKTADVTLTPVLATKQGPALKAHFREAFNQGYLDVKLSGGQDRGEFGDSVFANGTFDLNQNWRAGFSYNRASNPQYLDDFSILPNASYLESNVFLEGFTASSYARIDAQTYQGLVASVNQSELPIVGPYAQYHYVSPPSGPLNGTLKIDTSFFNVMRDVGTNTRRLAFIPSYSVPFTLPAGIIGTARLQLDAAYYNADKLNQQPNYSEDQQASIGRAQPYGAVMLRWPLMRPTARWGSQLIEPIVQLVASPNIGISQNDRIPNEDSLDLEFSDANLFALNRYPGIDRLEGGSRVDYAMHAAWYLPGGMTLDGLIGQSYRFHKDSVYLPASGLTDNASDIVARAVVAPTSWLNITYRGRFSHTSLGNRMTDVTANVGPARLRVSGGYLYTSTNPYALYDNTVLGEVDTLNPPAAYFTPRQEATLNVSSQVGQWNLSGGGQRNLKTGKFDVVNADIGWQNDCFGVNLLFYKRFTSFNLDNGSTAVLLQFNFKTLGTVGFNAL
ncbi:LPS-assembly protein LptD [Acidocella facilis]|uniref:LPS-assembly protein LptD n=1 Tax=Acidocella facilis TaxID=525 RepID=UPI00047E995B|nr:LPS assembly protein LptD [Acidocella facilis]